MRSVIAISSSAMLSIEYGRTLHDWGTCESALSSLFDTTSNSCRHHRCAGPHRAKVLQGFHQRDEESSRSPRGDPEPPSCTSQGLLPRLLPIVHRRVRPHTRLCQHLSALFHLPCRISSSTSTRSTKRAPTALTRCCSSSRRCRRTSSSGSSR